MKTCRVLQWHQRLGENHSLVGIVFELFVALPGIGFCEFVSKSLKSAYLRTQQPAPVVIYRWVSLLYIFIIYKSMSTKLSQIELRFRLFSKRIHCNIFIYYCLLFNNSNKIFSVISIWNTASKIKIL